MCFFDFQRSKDTCACWLRLRCLFVTPGSHPLLHRCLSDVSALLSMNVTHRSSSGGMLRKIVKPTVRYNFRPFTKYPAIMPGARQRQPPNTTQMYPKGNANRTKQIYGPTWLQDSILAFCVKSMLTDLGHKWNWSDNVVHRATQGYFRKNDTQWKSRAIRWLRSQSFNVTCMFKSIFSRRHGYTDCRPRPTPLNRRCLRHSKIDLQLKMIQTRSNDRQCARDRHMR